MGTCEHPDSGNAGPAWIERMGAARRLAPVAPAAAELGDLVTSPAIVLRVYGRGDDPLSVVLEWRDIPSQVTLASAARTLVGIVEQPLVPASSTAPGWPAGDDAPTGPGR